MNTPHQQVYVENVVTGDFDEEKLKELFQSEEYRPYADRVFEHAVSHGNREIHPESILWWQEAVANENQPPAMQAPPQQYEQQHQEQPFQQQHQEHMPPEQQQTDLNLEEQQEEKKDGGEIYLILLTLFLIAYGIKYLID